MNNFESMRHLTDARDRAGPIEEHDLPKVLHHLLVLFVCFRAHTRQNESFLRALDNKLCKGHRTMLFAAEREARDGNQQEATA